MKQFLLGILVTLLVVGAGIGGWYLGTQHPAKNDDQKTEKKEKTNEKEKQPVEKKSNSSIVITNNNSEDKIIYQLDDNFEEIWKYEIKTRSSAYNNIQVDGDYIYYTDNDMLYRRNYKTDKTENLDIKMKEYWNFYVDGDILVYDVVQDFYHVDLNTKKQTKLDFQTNNASALIDGVLYYTSNDKKQSLTSYNFKTKETKTIVANARIMEYDKESILYANKNDEVVLYNTKEDKQTVLFKEKYALESGLNYPIHLYNNKAYVMKDNSLDIINESKESIYKYDLKEKQKVNDFIIINEDIVLLTIFTGEEEECQGDVCGPEGEETYFLVDIKNNKTKEIKDDKDLMNEDGMEVFHIYE